MFDNSSHRIEEFRLLIEANQHHLEDHLHYFEDKLHRVEDTLRHVEALLHHVEDMLRHVEAVLHYVEDMLRHVEAMLRRRNIASTLRFHCPSNGRRPSKGNKLKYKVMSGVKNKSDWFPQSGHAVGSRDLQSRNIKRG